MDRLYSLVVSLAMRRGTMRDRLLSSPTDRSIFEPDKRMTHPMRRRAILAHAIERLEPRVVLSAGDLDLTFSGDGIQAFNTGGGLPFADAAVDSSGNVVVLFVDPQTGAAAIQRFLANGSVDPTFPLISGSGLGPLQTPKAIAVQSSGKIITAGHTTGGDILVMRYTTTGGFDDSFGNEGATAVLTNDQFTVNDLIVRPNDHLVIGGNVSASGQPGDFLLIALTEPGQIDTGFGGGDGIVTTDFQGDFDQVDALGLLSGGRIVAAGRSFNPTPVVASTAIAVYDSIGTPNLSFSGDGQLLVPQLSENTAATMAIAPGDRMAFLDVSSGPQNDNVVAAVINDVGAFDTNFSGDGISQGLNALPTGSTVTGSVAVDAAGLLVVSFDEFNAAANTLRFVRFTPDGQIDSSFNGPASISTGTGGGGFDSLLALPGNRMISAIGIPGFDVALIKFETSHSPKPTIASFTGVTGATVLNVRVRYEGEAAIVAGSISTGNVRLAGPGNYNAAAISVATQTISSTEVVVTYSFPAPGGTVDPGDNGGYSLEFQTQAVTDTNDNAVASPPFPIALNVGAGLPDLAFSNTSFTPGLYFLGDSIQASLTASAVGLAPASFVVQVVLSPDGIAGNADDIELQRTVVTSGSQTLTSIGPIPTDVAPGDYFLFARLDPDAAIAEFDEANNQLGSKGPSIRVRPAREDGPPPKGIGQPDSSFGNDGRIRPSLGFSNTAGILEQTDGSILILGALGGGDDRDVGIARRTSDGSSDPSFGDGNGFIGDNMRGTDEQVVDIALLPDGRIIVAGWADEPGPGGGADFFVTKRNTDGSRDTSFGDNGRVFIDFDLQPQQGGPSRDLARDMLIDSQGRILVVGRTDAGASINFALARITATGQLDSTFGVNGRMITDFAGGLDSAEAVALTSTGAIVVAGNATQGSVRNVALAQYTDAGVLDTAFGDDGRVVATAGGTDERANAIAITPTGQIVVAGFSATGTVGTNYDSDMLAARFTSKGKADKKFSGDGVATMDVGIPARATHVEVLADGRVIASGIGSSTLAQAVEGDFDIVISRFTTTGLADTSFDDDGFVILSTADTSVSSASAASFVPLNVNVPFATAEEILEDFQESAEGKLIDREGGGILIAGTSGAQTVVIAVITSGIELSGEVISSVPSSIIGGNKGSIAVNVANLGDILAEGLIDVAFYASTDQELGSGDSQFYGVNDRAVKLKPLSLAGKAKKITAKFTYPSDLPDGTYYILAVVSSDSITELSTDNNTAFTSTPIVIAAPVTDLTGPDFGGTNFVTGKTATVPVTLQNQGNVTLAGTASLVFVFSADELLDSDDFTSAAVAIKVNLKAGASKAFKAKLAAPPIDPGDYFVFIILDSTNVVAEVNEANNLLSSALTSSLQ